MRTILPMNGRINRDVNPLYIDSEKGEVVHRKNARVYSADGSRSGINTSIKGMSSVSASLPAGTNTIVGYVEDKERDVGIFFNKNSNGYNDIYIYNGTTVKAMGIPHGVLTLSTKYLVQADILGDWCVFTDNLLDPRIFPVVNSSGVVQPANAFSSYTADMFLLAKKHPVDAPTFVIGSDEDKKINKLVGKSFQFATYYIYNDYTYSVLSPYSKLAVSAAVFDEASGTYVDNSDGNYVDVSYDTGGSTVQSVVLVAREGNNGSWFKVEEYDKVTGVTERTVSFYNDRARQYISVNDKVVDLYSDVPLKAKSVLSVQNRIGFGGITKGYNQFDVGVTYDVEYETTSVGNNIEVLDSDYGLSMEVAGNIFFGWDVPAAPNEGDTIHITIAKKYQQTWASGEVYSFDVSYHFTYEVQSGDTQADVVQAIINDINTRGLTIVSDRFDATTQNGVDYTVYGSEDESYDVALEIGTVWSASGTYGGGEAGSYNLPAMGSTLYTSYTYNVGINTYKSGSYYNVGLVGYDDRSRTCGVVNSQRVYIPANGERNYDDASRFGNDPTEQTVRARIKFIIGGEDFPLWVTRVRFAITPSINFAGVYPFVTGNDTDVNIRDVYLDGKNVLAINIPTNLQYEFAKGDWLQLETDSGTAVATTIKAIIGTRSTITDSGTDYAGFWLIIDKGDNAVTDFENQLLTIYRPKDEVSEDGLVYFEDSVTYTPDELVEGYTGYIDCGDAWFTKRLYKWNGGSEVPVVEDFYIDVDNAVRAYNRGRAVAELNKGQVTLQDFVWSEAYLDNTEINGMSFFSSLDRKQMDEKDGNIQVVRLVGDVVKIIQDNKETSLYIGRARFADGAGNISLARVNDFIGDVYPLQTEHGTRYPQSVTVYRRNIYYWDGDKGQVIRSSPNGQEPISDYGMKSEFLRIKNNCDSGSSVKVLSHYDKKNDEFVITFNVDGTAETWAFKEGVNEWVAEYEYVDINDNVPQIFGNLKNNVISFLEGKVYKHEDSIIYNLFYGDYKEFLVKGVLNVYPDEEKCLRALKTDSTHGLDTVIETPVTNTNSVGQKSILYAESYRERSGSYTSAVYSNILGSGGIENISLLHSGNDIVGKYIEIEFSLMNATADEIRLALTTASITINK